MSRVIMSVDTVDAKGIEVTPEAINRFYVKPIELKWCEGGPSSAAPVRYFEVELLASLEGTEPILLTAKADIACERHTFTRELDENTFASHMVAAIVNNHGDINDVDTLKDAMREISSDIAYKIWEKTGAAYTGLTIPGFGYIESGNDVVAVSDGLSYKDENAGMLYASYCTDITSYTNLGKGRFHFLPQGMDRFLVYNLDVKRDIAKPDGEKMFLLNETKSPEPSKEVPVSVIPRPRREYASMDAYLDAVTKYIQKHMGAGNDRRVELEDDLIF